MQVCTMAEGLCFIHHIGEYVFSNIFRTVHFTKKMVVTIFVENQIPRNFYLKLFFVRFVFILITA